MQTLAKIQVTAIFSYATYAEKRFLPIQRDLHGHAILVPIYFWMGTNMEAGKQQKHLSLSFATIAQIYLSTRGSFLQYKNSSDSQIPRNKARNKSHFNQLGRHVNCASPKNLEIQGVVYHKAKNLFGTKMWKVWIVVFSCSYTSLK